MLNRNSKLLLLLASMTFIVVTLASCSFRPREIQYARSTQKPDETKGMMRLAQDVVQVIVDGGDGSVATFGSNEKSAKAEKKHLSAYIILHEQDVAQFVRNTIKLKALIAAHPELVREIQ